MVTRVAAHKSFAAFTVHIVPTLRDNFTYIIQDTATAAVALVDVSELPPVERALKALGPQARLTAVLTTHKHWDHSGGNKEIAARSPQVPIFGGARDNVPHCTRPVSGGDVFTVGSLRVSVIDCPCHTSGHVAYYVTPPASEGSHVPSEAAVFTGDTLFAGGIGAFFEGDAAMMLNACRGFAKLPLDTCVFPGHEYTVNFLKFTKSLLPYVDAVQQKLTWCEARVAEGLPTVPTTIREELMHNLFMRCDDVEVQKLTNETDPVKVMQFLYEHCP